MLRDAGAAAGPGRRAAGPLAGVRGGCAGGRRAGRVLLAVDRGRGGIGTFDLCRDRPGMLSDEQLADALVAADIARDAVLYQPYAAGSPGLEGLLEAAGTDRIVIHQATGMIAVQLGETTPNALARLRAAAFASGRSIYDIAQDVVKRRVRFDE
jgi:ANTAR domain